MDKYKLNKEQLDQLEKDGYVHFAKIQETPPMVLNYNLLEEEMDCLHSDGEDRVQGMMIDNLLEAISRRSSALSDLAYSLQKHEQMEVRIRAGILSDIEAIIKNCFGKGSGDGEVLDALLPEEPEEHKND